MTQETAKMKEAKAVFLVQLSANIPTLGLLALSGWFAYLDNGYWGWPFAFALLHIAQRMEGKLKALQDKLDSL